MCTVVLFHNHELCVGVVVKIKSDRKGRKEKEKGGTIRVRGWGNMS